MPPYKKENSKIEGKLKRKQPEILQITSLLCSFHVGACNIYVITENTKFKEKVKEKKWQQSQHLLFHGVPR